MGIAYFDLRNVHYDESIARIAMEASLLEKFISPETFTLNRDLIFNGGHYSLFPLADIRDATIGSLKKMYLMLTTTPCPHMSAFMDRQDGLVNAVGLLFSKIEYVSVESADDLDALVNPMRHPDYNHKKVYRFPLEGLFESYEDAVKWHAPFLTKPNGSEEVTNESSESAS